MVRLLVPVDFSPGSSCAVERGFKLLPRVERAVFAYVLPLGMKELEDFLEPGALEEAKRRADEKMREFLASLSVEADEIDYIIAEGDPASVLLELANSGDYDAVLIPHKGHSYLVDVLIGSVTLKLVAKSRIPVIVVRKPEKC